MSKVILCSAEGMGGPLGHPVLQREGIELSIFTDLPRAFLELKTSRIDLLILEEGDSMEATLAFVRRIGDVTANADIKIICLWKSAPPADLPKSLAISMPFPPPEETYEKAIVGALAIEARKARRILLRMSLSMRAADQSFLCTTVDVSRTGVLVESNRSLQVNGVYDVKFMGLSGPALPTFKVRVAREKPPKAKLNLRYYACAFEEIASTDLERLAKVLEL